MYSISSERNWDTAELYLTPLSDTSKEERKVFIICEDKY